MIVASGFHIGGGGKLGRAIYFATTASQARARAQVESEVVLECVVKLGPTVVLREADPDMDAHRAAHEFGCHSVAIETNKGPTYAVYHANKISNVRRV